MDLNQVAILILSSIGVLNGLMLSIYFTTVVKPKEIQNYFLGILLFLLSIRIGKSVIFYFLPETSGIDIYIQVGLSAWFLIGPFLYFYIYYFVQPHLNKHLWKYHLGVNGSFLFLFNFYFPYTEHARLWHSEWINATFLQIFIYLILAGIVLAKNWGIFPKQGSQWKSKHTWILCIYWGNFLIWLAYFMTGLTSYILGAISFTFMLYLLISLLLMSSNERSSILFKNLLKYGGRIISDETSEGIVHQLEKALTEDEIFTNPQLKLNDLAELLNISSAKLSQIINEKMGKSFSQLIVEYRIAKAKTMILHNEQLSLEGIGYECGFKAKTTFFAAFKKLVGTTPAQFKKEESST